MGANDRPLLNMSISCWEKEYELKLCVIWDVLLVLILPLKKAEFSFVLWLEYVVRAFFVFLWLCGVLDVDVWVRVRLDLGSWD